ncbi:MAG: phosphate signaling complex protein PhoU [Verrucomicrobiota bacterium]|jgi:phosphate transport system protein|nr:phosphate signaling complex protein PhoU [Verrucomicrobiota bacterium]
MSTLLDREIDQLQRRMLDLGGLAEASVRYAVQALQTHDTALAQRVSDDDTTLDAEEVVLEEACLKVLALHQPVAVDLRVIIGILKINNDLERVGDLAVSIAQCVHADQAEPGWPAQLSALTAYATGLVSDALTAFVQMNRVTAVALCLKKETFRAASAALEQTIRDLLCVTHDARTVRTAMAWLAAGHALRRICEHAVNLAENVIYIHDGIVIRHHANRIPET